MNTTETENICGLKRADFQSTIAGKETDLYILRNSEGNEVAISNYGGALVAIMVPDRNGNRANVIQGHDNINDIVNSPEPYLSTLIGRYGNRICKGRFQLHGKEYQLPINNGPNSLHGGLKGFNAKVWDALQMNDHTLVLKYVSPYGEEGFSGEMKTTVVYSFTDDNELVIEYMATTNKKTIVNLTSHGFFSLAGIANPTPTIENLECEINADFYIPVSVVGEKASAHGLHGTCYTSVDEAYEHALADADKDDFVFVGGSSYVVADLLTYLKNNN